MTEKKEAASEPRPPKFKKRPWAVGLFGLLYVGFTAYLIYVCYVVLTTT